MENWAIMGSLRTQWQLSIAGTLGPQKGVAVENDRYEKCVIYDEL